MNFRKMFSGNLLDAMQINSKGNTTFHLVNLKTKVAQEFVAPPFVIYHFANVHENANGDIVFEQPTSNCNLYYLFHMPTALNTSALDSFRDECENVLRRFTLHRSGPLNGTVSTRVLDAGWMEFPQFNPLWRGKEACFLYQVEWYHGGVATYASMALVKFNLCKGVRAATWRVPAHFPAEPKFIPRPTAIEEDDGVVVTPVLDGNAQTSYLLVLDAKTMHPLEKFDIALRVPITLHGIWKSTGSGTPTDELHGILV